MIYKTIEVRFWGDRELKSLSLEARFLFVYFMTNRQAHYTGLYEIAPTTILYDTCFTEAKFKKAMVELEAKPFVSYDRETDLVWVVNMLEYSLKIGNQHNLIKGISKQMGTLSKSFLLNNFFNKYKHLTYTIPMGYEWVTDPFNTDTVTDTVTLRPVEPKKDKVIPDVKSAYGEFKNVLLTDVEHQKSVKKFGDNGTKELIARLDGYIEQSGKSYQSHYATILNWSRKDNKEAVVKSQATSSIRKCMHSKCTEENPINLIDRVCQKCREGSND